MSVDTLHKYDELPRNPFISRTVRGMSNSPEEVIANFQFDFIREKAESGESFVAAAIREVYEETGLVVESLQLCGIKEWENEDGSRYIVFFYKTNRLSLILCQNINQHIHGINIQYIHCLH